MKNGANNDALRPRAGSAAAAISTDMTNDGRPKRGQVDNPCGRCWKEVKLLKEGLMCRICSQWYHFECIAEGVVTPAGIDMAEKFNLVYGKSNFMCTTCTKVVPTMNHEVKGLVKEIKQIRVEMKDLTTELHATKLELDAAKAERDLLKTKIEMMEANNNQVKEKMVGMEKEIESGMEQAIKEVTVEMTAEKREQEERASNIAIYGIKESEKDTAEEKKEDDVAAVRKIADELGIEVRGEVEAKYRAGKKVGDKPRPMIVRVANDEMREALLKKAHMLGRKDGWKSVYVQQDLTWKQREEAKAREQKLKDEENEKNEQAKNEGRTGGRYVRKGWGERRKVVWWWDTRESRS